MARTGYVHVGPLSAIKQVVQGLFLPSFVGSTKQELEIILDKKHLWFEVSKRDIETS